MVTFFSKPIHRTPIVKRKFNRIATTGAFFIALFSSSGGYARAVVETGEFDASELFYRTIEKDFAKVTFDENSHELSEDSFATLVNFVKASQREAKVERYIVATWADENYPSKGELSSEHQRRLAEQRSKNIKKGLHDRGLNVTIDTFEMTSQPNWIQRVFSTETAEIKKGGRTNTPNERLFKEIGQKLRAHGGPRTAVIVAKFRNQVLSE